MTPNKRGRAMILGKASNKERMYKKKEMIIPKKSRKIWIFFIKTPPKLLFL